MHNLEDDYQHPVIICKHQLDVSYVETFGKILSDRLQLNVEMSDPFLLKETIYYGVETKKVQLFVQHSTLISEIRYHLQFDEVLLIIYDDFFEIIFDFTVDYFHLLQLNQRDELKEIAIFKGFFRQLHNLGINELYFGVFDEFEKAENLEYCWNTVYQSLLNSNNHFKIMF